jgi:hypothetical protein
VSLEQIELADGETPCPRCGDRPPYKDPWSQPFEGDEFYVRIGRGSRLAPAIATCTGCTCLMLFDPR